jgi:hypothetical protein
MPPVDLLGHVPRDNKLKKIREKCKRGWQDQDTSLGLVEVSDLRW